MRKFTVALSVLLMASLLPALGQSPTKAAYRLVFDSAADVKQDLRTHDGRTGIFVTVRFTIEQVEETSEDVQRDYKIVISEDGAEVRRIDVPAPKLSDEVSVMLAVDMSGSMVEGGKVEQAKKAGSIFFEKLPGKAECGLVLFDHALRYVKEPFQDRALLRQQLQDALPGGGTAYLDAAARSIDLLRAARPRRKVAVVMTDGVDLNSTHTMEQVIQQARGAGVQVFTIGLGEPGRNDLVTSVLALDKSGSMLSPADDIDKVRKIDAVKAAAIRFIDSMRPTARTTVLDFSDTVSVPPPFASKDRKDALRGGIDRLKAKGETAFLDAAYTAVMTLEAENPPGKKAVVVLTDGIDNSSRHRVDEVIQIAKDAKIPLHMLGFGRESEIDAQTMQAMADRTGGKYFHARNEKDLLVIFEKLSIELHDDGIDEVTLKQLATRTGGQYFPAKNVADLQRILVQVSEKLPAEVREVTYLSPRSEADGTRRTVRLDLVYRGTAVQTEKSSTQVRGLVLAKMDPLWYLVLLVGLGFLLAAPAALRAVLKGGAPAR